MARMMLRLLAAAAVAHAPANPQPSPSPLGLPELLSWIEFQTAFGRNFSTTT